MTADDAMAARTLPVRLVIFDCDGVLIDSESVANRVVAAELGALGWVLDAASSQRLFTGMSYAAMEPLIAARIGRPVDPSFRPRLAQLILTAMAEEAVLIDGALEAIAGVEALGLPWRVASNSSHAEMRVKFARTGLADRVAGRLHSFGDVGRGKPDPDLFLATAAAQGVGPAECLVIEDSVPGAMAAKAARMDCLGFAPLSGHAGHMDTGPALQAQGAYVIRSMQDVPRLLRRALRMDQ